jgi:serine/threonine protein kinase
MKNEGDHERVRRELEILKKTRHPHIIQYYEVKRPIGPFSNAFLSAISFGFGFFPKCRSLKATLLCF